MAVASAERILVVEDDPASGRFLAELLEHTGYVVETEQDAYQAVARVRERPYDLVISDVVMPKITGTALVAQLGRLQPGLPALLVSAFPDAATRAEAKALGVPLLAKPFRADTLLSLVDDLLTEPSAIGVTR
jgi:CheY-like chemotaxis protein